MGAFLAAYAGVWTGFANVWWMAEMAVAMAYETMGRHGRFAASAIGALLIAFAALILATGWIPAIRTP